MKKFHTFVKMYDLNLHNINEYKKYIFLYLNSDDCIETMKWLDRHNIDLDMIILELSISKQVVKYNYIVAYLLWTNRSNLIDKYFKYFTDNNMELLELKKLLSGYNLNKDYFNQFIDSHPQMIIHEIVNKRSSSPKKPIDIFEEDIFNFLNQLIIELLRYEQKSYHDIIYIDRGAFSAAFQVGDKILKVGKERENFYIDNHRRYLKPLYRQNINSTYNGKVLFCIEITQVVDTETVTADDVYTVYKEFRDEGLIWGDPSVRNIGRLKLDNRIYFNEIDWIDQNSTGYRNENAEILRAGDIVIIDNDYIYPEKDFECNPLLSDGYIKYERRYRNELAERQKVLKAFKG